MKATRTVQGESYDRFVKTDIATKVAHIRHVTTSGDGEKIHMEYFLDMSGLSEEELLGAAAKNINIRWMRPGLFRTMKADEVIAIHGETLQAVDYRPEKRQKKSKRQTLIDYWVDQGLDEETAVKVVDNPDMVIQMMNKS